MLKISRTWRREAMHLFHKYLHKLYLVYFKWKNTHSRNVIFQKSCVISDDDFFEGNNNVGGRIHRSHIGYGTYIVGENGYIHDCRIGRFCSIASNCHIGLGDHTLDMVSTSPLFYSAHSLLPENFLTENIPMPEQTIGDTKYKVMIGNDVWMGYNVCVKEGVTIGDGAIIGAKSLVTRDIPPYAIAVGTPARVIKYRFTPEQIQKLLEIKWWDQDPAWIKENIHVFHDIDTFIAAAEISAPSTGHPQQDPGR